MDSPEWPAEPQTGVRAVARCNGEDLSRAFWPGTIRTSRALSRRHRCVLALALLAAAGRCVFSGSIASVADHPLSHSVLYSWHQAVCHTAARLHSGSDSLRQLAFFPHVTSHAS